MSFVLVTTWGSLSANAYVAVADADDFLRHEVVDNQPWLDATAPQRQAALVEATRDIDAVYYQGDRYFYRQTLAFPRIPPNILEGSIGPYGPSAASVESDVGFFTFLEQDEFLLTQKARVEKACALQAVWLLRNKGRNLDREAQSAGIASQSTGRAGVSESYSYDRVALQLCPAARDLLRTYRGSPRVVRGSGPDPTLGP